MYALEKKEISASTAKRCKNSPWLGVEQNNPSNSSIFMEHPVHTYIHTYTCLRFKDIRSNTRKKF